MYHDELDSLSYNMFNNLTKTIQLKPLVLHHSYEIIPPQNVNTLHFATPNPWMVVKLYQSETNTFKLFINVKTTKSNYNSKNRLKYPIVDDTMHIQYNDNSVDQILFVSPDCAEHIYGSIIVEVCVYIPISFKLSLEILSSKTLLFNQGCPLLCSLKWNTEADICLRDFVIGTIQLLATGSDINLYKVEAESIEINCLKGHTNLHEVSTKSIDIKIDSSLSIEGCSLESLSVKASTAPILIKNSTIERCFLDIRISSVTLESVGYNTISILAKSGSIRLKSVKGKCIKLVSKSIVFHGKEIQSELFQVSSNSASLSIDDSTFHYLDIKVLNTLLNTNNLFLDFMNIVTDSLILNLNQFESTMKIAIQSNSAQIKMKGKCVSKSQYTNISSKSLEDLKEFQSQDPTFDLSRVIQIKSDDANIDSNIEHYNVYNVICNNTTLKHQMTGKQGQLTDIKFTNGKVQVLLNEFFGIVDCKTMQGDIEIVNNRDIIFQDTPQHQFFQLGHGIIQTKLKCFSTNGQIKITNGDTNPTLI